MMAMKLSSVAAISNTPRSACSAGCRVAIRCGPPVRIDDEHREHEGHHIAPEHGNRRRQRLHQILGGGVQQGKDDHGGHHQQDARDARSHGEAVSALSAPENIGLSPTHPCAFRMGSRPRLRRGRCRFRQRMRAWHRRIRRGRSTGRRPRSPPCRSPACARLPPKSARRNRRPAPRTPPFRSRAP
jgi:hypothetical protein